MICLPAAIRYVYDSTFNVASPCRDWVMAKQIRLTASPAQALPGAVGHTPPFHAFHANGGFPDGTIEARASQEIMEERHHQGFAIGQLKKLRVGFATTRHRSLCRSRLACAEIKVLLLIREHQRVLTCQPADLQRAAEALSLLLLLPRRYLLVSLDSFLDHHRAAWRPN